MALQRGLDEKHEQNQQQIIRDTRPIFKRISDFFSDPQKLALFMGASAIVCFVVYFIAELFLILSIIGFIYCFTRDKKLPFKMPQRSGELDYNDLHPGTKKPTPAKGIYHFGNQLKTKDEIWFSNDDMRTHALIFGSTGSGKTQLLISLAYNALLQASGFIYVDGKGDNSVFSQIFSMVRSMGRDDDILLINFMTGARDIIGPQEKKLSNTLNPFANGSSSMLAQLVVALMDSSSGSSDGDMWKGRAIGFVESLMKVLVAMRDAGHILLDANVIRNYFHLPRLEAIIIDKVFIRDGQDSINLDFLPDQVLEPLTNYVLTLPGFNREKKGKQVSQVLEQHGFITMQLVRVFTSLADTYGHILRTNLAEVDLSDVVLNRRILCVLLPALEKSPAELSQLGKVIIATLKAMMAAGLGDSVEGDLSDIVDSRPTASETPFLCILDEYGYYAVEGFAVVPAQARSLGFSVIFAGQDLPAFQKASKEEAASIGANTNIKVCMKLEDPTETWDFFMKSAGESYVSQVESFQVDQGSLIGNYQDGKGARMEKRARVDLLDLKEQDPGEYHIFFRSKIVRAKSFYADPKPVKYMRLNHFLKVDCPEDSDVAKFFQAVDQFQKIVKNPNLLTNIDAVNEEVEKISHLIELDSELSPSDCALAVVNQYFKPIEQSIISDGAESRSALDIAMENMLSEAEEDVEEVDYLSIFTPMKQIEKLMKLIKTDDIKGFTKPIVNRKDCRDRLEYIERLCGKSAKDSLNIAMEVTGDMEKGTYYPQKHIPATTSSELVGCIKRIIEKIRL